MSADCQKQTEGDILSLVAKYGVMTNRPSVTVWRLALLWNRHLSDG
jgi:hypothetical protein